MLTLDEISFLTRMGERLIGVLIGGMSVYLGYRLFASLPDKTDSAGKVVLPGGVSILLSRVGPGIFFALFGAAIVTVAFTERVDKTTTRAVSTTDPGGASYKLEESTRLRGAAPVADAGPLASRRVAEARTQIFTLNHDWPRALKADLHPDERKMFEVTRDYSKSQILRAVWLPEWGSPVAFEDWVRNGARKPVPSTIGEPASIYLSGLELAR